MLSYIKSAAAAVVTNVTAAAAQASQQPIEVGGRSVVIREQLGEGGFAFVYSVEDVVTGEQFAMKRMLCQDKEARDIAEKEIAMLRQLRGHPNILKLIGSSKRENTSGAHRAMEYFLLLELCTGGSLIDLIRRRNGRPLGELQVCDLFAQICAGVAHMHSQQPPICHRDLKIENVLIDARGHLKLCDFGSCTTRAQVYASNRERVEEEEIIGKYSTAMYRAPELAEITSCLQPKLVNEKVDVWALGCVLYTIAFYTQPFQDGGNLQIISGNYDVPESHAFSKYLTALIKRLLTVDPTKRPDMRQVLGLVAQWRAWLQAGGVPGPTKPTRAVSGEVGRRAPPGPATSVTDPVHQLQRHHSAGDVAAASTASKPPKRAKLPKEQRKQPGPAIPEAAANDDWADFGDFPAAAAAPATAAAPLKPRAPTKAAVSHASSSDDSSSDEDDHPTIINERPRAPSHFHPPPVRSASATPASTSNSSSSSSSHTAQLFDTSFFTPAPANPAPHARATSTSASASSSSALDEWEADFGSSTSGTHSSNSAAGDWGSFESAVVPPAAAAAAARSRAPRASPTALDFGFDFSGLSPPPAVAGGQSPRSASSPKSASKTRRVERRQEKKGECIDISKINLSGSATGGRQLASASNIDIGAIKIRGPPAQQR